jgi:hypothetical protein
MLEVFLATLGLGVSKELPMAPMFVNGLGRNDQSL